MKTTAANEIIKQSSVVDGWFSKEAGMLIAIVDEFQKTNGISGDIFEIGVHHGKSSIFFSHLLSPSENLHVCDLFGGSGNVSNSGSGNEDIFRRNMVRFGLKSASVYHRCLSSSLIPENLGKNYRMFHVDGGHNPDEALSDLLLAAEVIHKQGIIILDDPFRVEWPGVTEALIRFLQMRNDFESIVVGFNKLLLSRKEIASQYREFLSDTGNREMYGIGFPWEFKQLPFAENPISIFFIPHRYLGLKKMKVWIRQMLSRFK
jgi:hypothetical protein